MDPVKLDILNAALAEFAQVGFEGARIDAIAARTDTSKRMIYYHFGNKEGLYAETLEHAYRVVRSGPPPSAHAELPPLQALAAYAASVFDTFHAHPDFVRLVIQENLQGGRFVARSAAIREMNQHTLGLLRQIVERGQAEGSMRPELQAIHVYINFIGLCHYNISSRHTYQALFDIDLTNPAVLAARKQAICESIVRYVQP